MNLDPFPVLDQDPKPWLRVGSSHLSIIALVFAVDNADFGSVADPELVCSGSGSSFELFSSGFVTNYSGSGNKFLIRPDPDPKHWMWVQC